MTSQRHHRRSPRTRQWQHFVRAIYQHIAAVTWPAILLIAAIHFLSSWAVLTLAHEPEITPAAQFWYFYLVTATTVGYGDLSPVSPLGRAVAVFWIMPGGIAVVTSIIAKVVQTAASYWRRRMLGLGDYSTLEGHTVIIGWGGERTRKMVAFMRSDQPDREIVLAACRADENPMPDKVHFVRGDSLTDHDLLARAGVSSASRAVVVGQDDNETLAACLAVSAHNKAIHLVAFFAEEAVADLLKAHCPTAECLVPMSTELLVRTADDPGSSRVPKLLLSTLDGPTLYSMTVPPAAGPLPFGVVFLAMRKQAGANVLGVAFGNGADELELNPPDDRIVSPGETLYYMANKRVPADRIAWADLGKEPG